MRTEFLDLIVKFYIPMGERLRIGALSLVIAIAPGFDEESTDNQDRCMHVFREIGKAVSWKAFFQEIWTALIFSNNHRFALLNFLSKVFPKRLNGSEFDPFGSANFPLVMKALCACLSDPKTLVSRITLDIMSIHLPLSDFHEDNESRSSLVFYTLALLTRKDISISRRVYSWIFGGSEESLLEDALLNSSVAIEMVVDSLKIALKSEDVNRAVIATKILIFMNDKPVIMNVVFPSLVFDMIAFIWHHSKSTGEDGLDVAAKVLQPADELFESVNLNTVWAALLSRITQIRDLQLVNALNTISYGMTRLKICEDEASWGLLPLFLSVHLSFLTVLCVTFTISFTCY